MVRVMADGDRTLVNIPVPRFDWPSVGVVVATADRPNLVRRALAAVAAQDYPGPMRVVVVYDRTVPDWRLAKGGHRPVLVLENWRAPGRAGARNTGILAVGDCDLVAICDDHDVWAPDKLSAQVSALRRSPGAVLATCAYEIEYDGTRRAHRVGRSQVGLRHLVRRSRGGLRGSTFVAVQRIVASDAAHGGIGLLSEVAPPGGEEWDLLVRAARRAPIAHVDEPLVRVLWRPADLGPDACADRVSAMAWVLGRHPALAGRRRDLADLASEIACWAAAAGDRAEAGRWAGAAVRAAWWRPGALLAAAATCGVLRGGALRRLLRRHLPAA